MSWPAKVGQDEVVLSFPTVARHVPSAWLYEMQLRVSYSGMLSAYTTESSTSHEVVWLFSLREDDNGGGSDRVHVSEPRPWPA